MIARMKLERANYQSGKIPSTLNRRAVPCAPAESNGGQRCAALQERGLHNSNPHPNSNSASNSHPLTQTLTPRDPNPDHKPQS